MKTTYNYTVKKINETNTICTLSADGITPFDLEVPIVSDNYEHDLSTGTAEEKTTRRTEARIAFRAALRKYVLDYFAGKDIEAKAAQVVAVSPTIQAIEGQSFVINVNE